MATSVHAKISGLDTLESGLKTLKRSKLMVAHEFKTMLGAAERHHNDLKLAHLTGKAKDLVDQAVRDTKFYNILVKMLCEVKEKRERDQRQGLKKVYTWYMANKHCLYSGPHFGKQYQKQEAQEVIVKATTPRKNKGDVSTRIGSARPGERVRAKSAPASRAHSRTWRDSSFNWQEDLNRGLLSEREESVEPLDLGPEQEDDYEAELQGLKADIDTAQNTPLNTASDQPNTATTANTELIQEARMLSQAHGSPTMTPLGEQSVNITPSRAASRAFIHPISSMVNPHVALAIQQEQEKMEKLKGDQKSDKLSRADYLQAWQNFNQDRSYGQDIIGSLNFVGRSGTANDVRYVAHSSAEMPELHTKDVLRGYVFSTSRQMAPLEDFHSEDQKENMFLQQTLEEFYQTADAFYPTSNSRPVSAARSRVKSAPAVGRRSMEAHRGRPASRTGVEVQRRPPSVPNKLGHQLQFMEEEEPEPEVKEEETTTVRLDTVVNIIDSVSEDMVYFKEKLAPEAHPGFRQPMVTGLPSSGTACAESAASLRLPSPSARSNTPVRSQQAGFADRMDRPYSSPLARNTIKMVYDPDDQSRSPSPSRPSKDRCQSASVVDWRGRVQPDTMRYKWGKTKFGGYTYLKKLQQKPVSLRTAGSTSAGKRPKTAPITMKEKWKTQKPSDQNPRVSAQAASNSMTELDQHDVDNMMTVQYLLGSSDSRADSLLSLYSLDEDFLRSLRRSAQTPSGPLEYVSFVTPSSALVGESRSHSAERKEHPTPRTPRTPRADEDEGVTLVHIGENLHIPLLGETPIPEDGAEEGLPGINHEYLDKLVDSITEKPDQQQEREENDKDGDTHTEPTIHWAPEVERTLTTDNEGEVTQVTSVSVATKSPTPASQRSTPLQPLSLSQVWQFSGLDDDGDETQVKPGFILGPSPAQWSATKPHLRKQVLCADCIPMATTTESAAVPTKVERSAGRMPGQIHSASAQMLQLSRRHAELMKRVPPPRTPPSIPLPKARPARSRQSPRVGPLMVELEHHARKVRSPRSFVQYVKDLRASGESLRDISTAPSPSLDSLAGSLQVCRLSVPLSRQHSYSVLSDYSQEGLHSILKQPSELNLHQSDSNLGCIHEKVDGTEAEKSVTFATKLAPLPQKPMTAPPFLSNGQQKPESLGLLRQLSSLHSSRTSSLHSSQHSSRNNSEPNTPNSKNLARIGRPIAHFTHIPDPDEVAVAVQKQKEAAAAVDIQRLFRGYVARSAYKKLLSDERRKAEDKQRAAVEIQRMYRGHLARKQAIERRPPDPAMLEWAHNYRSVLVTREQERMRKAEERANELAQNYHSAHSKISVIGPHVNIYEIYHPKKTGPTKKELNMAATCIQRHMRGWLVRRKMEKLNRKAAWYGSSLNKMVKEYKSMLIRVQRQHGAEKPQAPFTYSDMNDYIDTRRRYESVFEKKAFGSELELGDVEQFFKECDLYPSQAEIEEAIDVVFKGNPLSRQNRGLKRHEILDIVFYIYTPKATGLENTRQSTWMNPIIDGVEARRLLGSEFVEEAPLEPCARLVIQSRREQREKERAAERVRQEAAAAEQMARIQERRRSEMEQAEEEKKQKKQRRVTYQDSGDQKQ